jgi:predicted transposase YbfD/YdcC
MMGVPSALESLEKHFAGLNDPRSSGRIDHLLIDIVLITICAVICGAEDWGEVEEYGLAKQSWLETFLALPNGIPSHDTFNRVFARISPEQLQQCFLNWIQAVYQITEGQVIAIDGKTLRGSCERGSRRSMIHMVSAWATENRLVLGQRKVDEKSNEITAIPELLRVLDLAGATVTVDAMGCQTEIAAQIIAQKGDYVLALKGNQGNLHQEVIELFNQAREQRFQGVSYDLHETEEQSHGRHERRRYWVVSDVFALSDRKKWANLTAVGCVESQRTVGDKITTEKRYYLLSVALEASQFAQTVRGHWGIENNLHWVLDVGFREDESRSVLGHSAENLAVIRHIAVNLVTQEKSAKVGTRAKRKKAGWDDQYLFKILAQSLQVPGKI